MNQREAIIEQNIQELLQEKDYLECQIENTKEDIRKIDLQIEQLYRELKQE